MPRQGAAAKYLIERWRQILSTFHAVDNQRAGSPKEHIRVHPLLRRPEERWTPDLGRRNEYALRNQYSQAPAHSTSS